MTYRAPTDPADDRVPCPACDGEGERDDGRDISRCERCNGRGWLRECERMCIVVAWTEDEWVHGGEPHRADLGERPGMIAVRRPRAAVWVPDGDDADLRRAEVYAELRSARVYTYPVGEPDPIGRAKADVMAVQS